MSRNSSGGRWFPLAATALLLVALVAIPLVAFLGVSPREDVTAAGDVDRQVVDVRPVTANSPDLDSFVENSTGSQITFLRLSDGARTGTDTERFARPALSLIKLYIAEYVIENGTFTEQYAAIDMISSSDDGTAAELYRKYPESIDEVAKKYGLLSTRAHDRWGYSVTSTYDVVSFIAQLVEEDPTHPILVAMAEATPIAADGYGQDFGTSVLPGVIGSKWGWSDDRDLHSSVSFGENFVVAAALTGSADDLTELVESQLADEAVAATGSTGS